VDSNTNVEPETGNIDTNVEQDTVQDINVDTNVEPNIEQDTVQDTNVDTNSEPYLDIDSNQEPEQSVDTPVYAEDRWVQNEDNVSVPLELSEQTKFGKINLQNVNSYDIVQNFKQEIENSRKEIAY
jgi:hypothetical protein